MNNKEVLTYFYGYNNQDQSFIDEVFVNGLSNHKGASLITFAWQIKDENKSIEEQAKNFGYNNVLIIKIPKNYIFPKIVDKKLKEIPWPIWKSKDSINEDNNHEATLINNLIYGVYSKKNNTIIENPNYNFLYDPSGLIFDGEQINYFAKNFLFKWHLFSLYRNRFSYEDMKKIDQNKHIWDDSIKQYNNYFEKRGYKR